MFYVMGLKRCKAEVADGDLSYVIVTSGPGLWFSLFKLSQVRFGSFKYFCMALSG